jgi:hypothetical protein
VWVCVIVVANYDVIEDDTFITRNIVSESYVMISVSHANVEIYDIIPFSHIIFSVAVCFQTLVTYYLSQLHKVNTDFNYFDQHLSTPFS